MAVARSVHLKLSTRKLASACEDVHSKSRSVVSTPFPSLPPLHAARLWRKFTFASISLSLTPSLSFTHTHTHTLSLSLFLSLPPSPSLFPLYSLPLFLFLFLSLTHTDTLSTPSLHLPSPPPPRCNVPRHVSHKRVQVTVFVSFLCVASGGSSLPDPTTTQAEQAAATPKPKPKGKAKPASTMSERYVTVCKGDRDKASTSWNQRWKDKKKGGGLVFISWFRQFR